MPNKGENAEFILCLAICIVDISNNIKFSNKYLREKTWGNESLIRKNSFITFNGNEIETNPFLK